MIDCANKNARIGKIFLPIFGIRVTLAAVEAVGIT